MASDDQKIQNKLGEAIQYVLQPPTGSNFLIINRTSDYLAELAEEAAKELGLKVKPFNLDRQGPYDNFPPELKEEIASGKYPRAFGFFTYQNTVWKRKETPARVEFLDKTIKQTSIGYLHAPGIKPDMILNGAGRADFQEMAMEAEKLLGPLKGVKTVQITAPAGTDIEIEIPSELIWETDCIIKPPDPYGDPGKWGNFIPGEGCIERRKKVSVAGREVEYPIKLIANGELVCDVCADSIDELVDPNKPIRISFKDGIVTGFSSEDEIFNDIYERWKAREKEYKGTDIEKTVMEELGIGINKEARKVKEMLEAEKMSGTIHAAAGHVRSHDDFIVDKPTVLVTYEDKSKRTIMENGVLILD